MSKLMWLADSLPDSPESTLASESRTAPPLLASKYISTALKLEPIEHDMLEEKRTELPNL